MEGENDETAQHIRTHGMQLVIESGGDTENYRHLRKDARKELRSPIRWREAGGHRL